MPERPALRPQHVTPSHLADLASLLDVVVGNDARDDVADDLPDDSRDVAVSGVTHDSRQIRPGDLYAALPGAVTHGARFAGAAVDAGAVALLTDPAGAELIAAAGSPGVPVLVVTDPRARLGELAATVYGHPARDLLLFGVTGTNGKTTTSYLLESGLRAAGHTTGLIGTVETRVAGERVPSVRTTPESTDVHALLAVMRERGVTACAMEVSSHALVFGRVDGIVFDVAGFTNLTQDHLDFHADIDDYFRVKASLFTPARARAAVVCVDQEYGRRLAASTTLPTTTVTTAPGDADWTVVSSRIEPDGATHAVVRHGGDGAGDASGTEQIDVRVPLPGAFNVANATLAVAMLAAADIDVDAAVLGVGSCPGVPGRMEQVVAGPGAPLAVVDYAHTPDAIQNVLEALRPRGRLIAVVGAGGDRDPHKRPLMGEAAVRGADAVVVTDDNPRSEDPAAIRAAVMAGAASAGPGRRGEVVEVAGRREAIRAALALVRDRADTVVVLGKGHEQGQEIAGIVHPFDDREVLREELRRWSENPVVKGAER